MSENNTTGGCGCGCGGHAEKAQTATEVRPDLGLKAARPGEGTSPAELAGHGAHAGGGCACGRH